MIFNICQEYYKLIYNNAKYYLLVKVQIKPIEKVEGAC